MKDLNKIILIIFGILFSAISIFFLAKYSEDKNNTTFTSYKEKKLMTERQKKILIENLQNIDIFENACIQWEQEIETEISLISRHKRVYGELKLAGKYESLENLKVFLKLFNISDDCVNNTTIPLVENIETNTYIAIEKLAGNKVQLVFRIKLPIKYNINEVNESIKYFIDINKKNKGGLLEGEVNAK